MNKVNPQLSIGLAQWHHPNWYPGQGSQHSTLTTYSQHFSSVEGNHSFYGLPSPETISQWKQQSHSDFKFCFKFPQVLTHQRSLRECHRPLKEFLDRVSPLETKLGMLWLQMPATFSPEYLNELTQFLDLLPKHFTYGIEVRHLGFFEKNDAEKQFNQLLITQGINRISFDTRALFAFPQEDAITQEALKAKPRVPLHVIATGNAPMVRFITPLDVSQGYPYLEPWVTKTNQWIQEGRHPYLFFHTPDNRLAPQLAAYFMKQLRAINPKVAEFNLWDQTMPQTELF